MFKGIYDKINSGYVENWKEIFKEIWEKVNYVCNDCGVNLLIVKNLCYVYYKNGIKYDNYYENFFVLCKDCYWK